MSGPTTWGWALGLLAWGSMLASAAAGPPLPEQARLHAVAAQRQAVGHPALGAEQRRWCGKQAAPRDAAAATLALQAAQADYRAAAAAGATPAALRRLVVLRECAAFQATVLQRPSPQPVWLFSELSIDPPAPPDVRSGHGALVGAVARNVDGPIAGVRVTFSQGLHMACFEVTDAQGRARCRLVDTHPHGPESPFDWTDAAHSGPLTATLAGRVAAEQVLLPAVASRCAKTFLKKDACS